MIERTTSSRRSVSGEKGKRERERESDVRSYCLEGGVINRGRFKGAFPITEAARVSG